MPERRRANRAVGRLFLAMIVAVAALMIGVGYQGYAGRKALVDSQRAGCERGKLDRKANALGWRTAQARAASQAQPSFAVIYERIADGLEERGRVDCAQAFPSARLWP